jgi:hypothetical protein
MGTTKDKMTIACLNSRVIDCFILVYDILKVILETTSLPFRNDDVGRAETYRTELIIL